MQTEPTAQPVILGIEVDDRFMGQNESNNVNTFTMLPGEPVDQAVYRICRKLHTFLTDSNHTHEIDHSERDTPFSALDRGWSSLTIRKTAEAPDFVMKPWWVDDGAGAEWFTMYWRVATRWHIDEEAGYWETIAAENLAEAAACRDTVRGRREAKKLRSWASEYDRRARVTRLRWRDVSN